jgi:hypothetical protein
MIMPLVFATDITYTHKPMTLWADSTVAGAYYPSTNATISVYSQNWSQIFTNVTMTPISTGIFAFNFTPNETGIYYTATLFFNGTDQVLIGSSTFYVQEDTEMLTAIMLGLVAIMIFFFIIGYNLITKPIANPKDQELKLQDLGMFFILLDFIFVIILLGLMQNFSQGQTYSGIMDAVYGIGVWVTILVASLYIIAYTIYRITVRIKAMQQNNNTQKR